MTSMFLFKPINPGKFNKEAMNKILEAEAHSIANDILLDFELTAGTWEHKVKFVKEVQVGPKSIDILVGTDDEIYGYVNDGTKPHLIIPRRARSLAFPSMSTPKTSPGVLVSGKGSRGGKTVFAAYVQHPGTKARKFDKLIAKTWKKKMLRRVEAAIKRGVQASGHAR